MKRLFDPRAWALIISGALLWASLEHNLARAVTVQKCLGGACVDICDGSFSTIPGDQLTYQIHCQDTIFTDGFEQE